MIESMGFFEEKIAIQQLSEVTASVTKALEDGRDLGFNSRKLSALFDDTPECVFLKDCNGRIIYSNESHDELYASQLPSSTVGLKSVTFLHSSMVQLSVSGDAMLINGCKQLKYHHLLGQPDGSEVPVNSVKLPLLNAQGTIQGILGLTKPLTPLARHAVSAELQRLGSIVKNLRKEEKLITKYVCDGVSNKRIAEQIETPLRTVENRRRSVLKKLNIETTAELIKIIVRLEDAGLTQMGV